jgi:single-strand DNA-binding protein
VTNFYIASNRKFKDNIGNWKEDVCFVGVVAWYKLAESCHENLRKGSAVLVEGELQSRNWKTEDGFTRNVVEIKARRIQFLNKREYSNNEFYADSTLSETQEESSVVVAENEEPPTNIVETPTIETPQEEDSSKYDFGYKDLKL